MSELAELLRSALSGGSVLALPVAVLGGVVTGLNPCCLPLYPAAAGACCAVRGQRMAFSNALSFVAGVAVATAALGIVAAMAGRILAGLGGWTVYAIAVLPLAMGAHLLGWVRLPMPSSQILGDHRGTAGAFVAGLLIWLVFAPCATPVLAAVLSYAAYEGSVAYGGVLLVLYGLGAGVPVLALGTAAGRLAQRLDALGWRRRVDAATGTVLLGVGFYLVWVA